MKRYNKKFILILIFVCSFVLFGCKNIRLNTYNDADNSLTPTPESLTADKTLIDENGTGEEKDNTGTGDSVNMNKNTEVTAGPAVIQPAANAELRVYTVNNSANVEVAIALVPKDSEITPQLIVDTVKEAMAENSLMIGIKSVTTENNTIIVNFYSDQPPFVNVGAGYETAILDAIAQSLVENLEDYNKVIYRVEGEAYVSGHVELGIDEVYLVD